VHVWCSRRVIQPGVIRLIADADEKYQLTSAKRIALRCDLLAQGEGLYVSPARVYKMCSGPEFSAVKMASADWDAGARGRAPPRGDQTLSTIIVRPRLLLRTLEPASTLTCSPASTPPS